MSIPIQSAIQPHFETFMDGLSINRGTLISPAETGLCGKYSFIYLND